MRLAVLVTGMPGSGKSVLSDIAEKLGIPVYNMGDFIRREAMRRGVPLTDEELGRLAMELRRQRGKGAVALLTVEELERDGVEVCLIDGVRSLDEVHVFKKHFRHVVIVAVHSSPSTRYKRLRGRGRRDDPKSWDEFVRRDLRELNLGIGNVIALADIMLVNEGTLEEFRDAGEKTLRGILAEVEKCDKCRGQSGS